MPCRLVARRVPADVAAARRKRLLDKSKRRGDRASALALALCDWTILLTNVPREQLSVDETVVLARMRWQIELVFKLWKSGGGIAVWRTDKPRVALCEVYGKPLAQVVRHWMVVVGAWSHCDRSLTKAAEIIQSMAMSLGAAMRSRETLSGLLHHMKQIMEVAARMDKRKHSPNAYDLMLSLDPEP